MSFDANRFDLCLALGKTFSQDLAFTDGTPVFRTLENVDQAAPARLTITNHSVPSGWPFLIQGAEGMPALNRPEAWIATVINANTIDIADLNAKDFDAYIANSGVILYNLPADLTGRTGTLSARATRSSTDQLFELGSGNIIIDEAESRVTIQMTAAETTALIDTLAGFNEIVYDLELPDASGKIDLWTWGDINILRDV